ncbi:MAG: hypothetical protein A3K10_04795 [Bacteroidetes bacterium RIFCSPLOWO2_12_FULL_31_6]|nr:MAG: hypothetical protein A3K10_04795 [Bacteroidetes bacterium RIFCSPLOWO2_12_FULL_31_6]
MLSIQRVILLLDDFHFEEFKLHLKKSNAELPLKLITQIRKDNWEQKESDDLCKNVYGAKDEKSKKKFFQLVHYTFRLTSYLSRNHPSYLTSNISKIEQLINKGELEKANTLAEILLDISEKTEDFPTAIAVLKYFAQQSFVLENKNAAIKYHQRITELLKNEHIINLMYLYMRQNLNFKGKSALSDKEMEEHLSFYDKYRNNESLSIQMLSRYAYCHTLNYLNDVRFYNKETLDEINSLMDDLEKNAFIIFSFSDDIQLNVDYLKLKHLIGTMNRDELQKETAFLIKQREPLRFWKNYVNTPEIIYLSIQASYFLTHYCQGYKKDYNENLPKEVRSQIEFYKKRCEEILAKPIWNEGMHVRFINLNNIYCGLLILGTKEEIKKAVEKLEYLLVNFQQIAFQRLYDALFATLILGYFFLEDNESIQECYKRYEKLTANINKNIENDLTIKSIYYASQWNSTQRKQYVEKLQGISDKAAENDKLKHVQNFISDVVDHYEIPMKTIK